ncbi:MAG TPA: FHA domain-containing protein [Arcobacter sp.]|nr:FHA domain-containing protein [Arcobacter sp.]
MKNQAWLIGRASADYAHIPLDNDTVSGNHATLNYQDGKFYLIDNNSKNGTFLLYSNETIQLNQHYEVRLDDEIYFGKKRCLLREIVSSAKMTKGVESSELIILNGNYYENSKVDTPIEEKIETPIDVKVGKGKRIRCLACTTPIFSNEICPKCGSDRHFKEIN